MKKENNGCFPKGKRSNPDGEFKKGQAPWNKGKKLTDEQKKNMGLKPGWHHTEETKQKMSKTRRGGKGRLCWNFREWRRKVFEQGGHKCKECGCEELEKLHPHHIIPFKENIELRFDVSNGEILCRSCHAKLEGFQKGHIAWAKGKTKTKEHRAKLSAAHKGKKLSDEHKKNIRIGLKQRKLRKQEQ